MSSSPRSLYTHTPHAHQPRNATERLQEQKAQKASKSQTASFNMKVAVWVTSHVGTMWCAWIFVGLGSITLLSVFGLFGGLSPLLAAAGGALSSYWLQLVLLPILAVGQNVLSQHAELQADEQFKATMRTLHENEQMTHHLDAQDHELLKQTSLMEQLLSLIVQNIVGRAGAVAEVGVPDPTSSNTAQTAPISSDRRTASSDRSRSGSSASKRSQKRPRRK